MGAGSLLHPELPGRNQLGRLGSEHLTHWFISLAVPVRFNGKVDTVYIHLGRRLGYLHQVGLRATVGVVLIVLQMWGEPR